MIDISGYVPKEQGEVASVLEPVAERFVFASSVSAYAGWPLEALAEALEVLECPPMLVRTTAVTATRARPCTGSQRPGVSVPCWRCSDPSVR